MEFDSTTTSKDQIANTESKKDSSEEGNEGYSYVSGQANLKPKVGTLKPGVLTAQSNTQVSMKSTFGFQFQIPPKP